MRSLLFAVSVLLIFTAHLIRVLRWELFIEVYEKPNRRVLIRALSAGYLLNGFLPFKLGELARAWIAGKSLKNGKALGVSTVVVERYLDIVFVGGIFVILSAAHVGGAETGDVAKMYVFSAAALLALGILVYTARSTVKQWIRLGASIFNDRIQTSILVFAWALIWNFKDIFQKISKRKLIMRTVAMWSCYLLSYAFFAAFLRACGIGTTWAGIFSMLFSQNGICGSASRMIFGGMSKARYQLDMFAYLLLPLLLLLGLTCLPRSGDKAAAADENCLRLLPQRDLKERLAFLERYFSDTDREYLQNYLKINQDVTIIRDYSAGSNATTMLCMDDHATFFRKYAFGADGDKLFQQVRWLEENQKKLPLPDILRCQKTDLYCYYDMPFTGGCMGFFEYAHCMPIEQVWEMMRRVLKTLESSIYQENRRRADPVSIHRYVESKVEKNLARIKAAKVFREILGFDTVLINGIECRNLSFYEPYLSERWLQEIFREDSYGVIHGDLTIENIICTRDQTGRDSFYLIDPNTGNIHDSPNLDYAKLLQSIHGGYEFLMSAKEVQVTGNRISFPFARSSAYMELHKLLRAYMLEELGPQRTRSIYYHEIIHWLRLMPYKVEKDGQRALLFYAGMLMVLKDVISMFEEDKEPHSYGKETAGAV